MKFCIAVFGMHHWTCIAIYIAIWSPLHSVFCGAILENPFPVTLICMTIKIYRDLPTSDYPCNRRNTKRHQLHPPWPIVLVRGCHSCLARSPGQSSIVCRSLEWKTVGPNAHSSPRRKTGGSYPSWWRLYLWRQTGEQKKTCKQFCAKNEWLNSFTSRERY